MVYLRDLGMVECRTIPWQQLALYHLHSENSNIMFLGQMINLSHLRTTELSEMIMYSLVSHWKLL